MNTTEDYPYWMALAHLPRWRTEQINGLLRTIVEMHQIALAEFFECTPAEWRQEFDLQDNEIADLKIAKADLPVYESLTEKLLKIEIELMPSLSEDYPATLKRNLQPQNAPPLLYLKGNPELLQEPAVAIIGSLRASASALEFTRNIADRCVRNFEVVVSGFAKGIARTALAETLQAGGRSILCLSQGLLTFSTGFKQYYEPILAGDLLVCSAAPPQARRSMEFAREQERVICNFAERIYVAETESTGPIWENSIAALQKGRTIYARKPEANGKNANNVLIAKGAIPVDLTGQPFVATASPAKPDVQVEPEQYDLFKMNP